VFDLDLVASANWYLLTSLAFPPLQNTGAVVFEDNKDIAWESSTWPLDPGRYVAAIIRNSDSAPFTPLAVSPAFRIRMPAISSELIAIVREDIAQLIYADGDLAAPFLRLGFHDSIGGPDGCVSYLSESSHQPFH
jgi:hypothetical protein